MPDSSEKSLSMAATAEAIMDAIADVQAYPEWTGAVKQVTITDPGDGRRPKRVEFVMDAGIIKDTYELEYDWAVDGRSVSWTLLRGKLQKAQRGSYTLQDNGTDTVVTYRLAVQLSIPLIGPLKRNAERVIMDTALKELRKRVEAPAQA